MGVWSHVRSDPLRGLPGRERRAIARAVFRGEAVDNPADAQRALRYIAFLQVGASGKMFVRTTAALASIPALGLADRLIAALRHRHGDFHSGKLVTVTLILAIIDVGGFLFIRRRASMARRAIGPNEELRARSSR